MALSYNEIRERNIARNEEFLNYLFPDGISSKENEGHSKKEISDQWPSSSSSKINIQELCQRIQHKLPSRSNEMRRIFEYLEQVSASDLVTQRHSSLNSSDKQKNSSLAHLWTCRSWVWVDGPLLSFISSRKSYVCATCLSEINSYPVVHLSCSRASSPKKVINLSLKPSTHSVLVLE